SLYAARLHPALRSFPTRRSSDLFQVAEYAKHFTCISLDLRGTGETDQVEGVYSTELLADDIAAFMQAAGIRKAHISGLSLGAARSEEHTSELQSRGHLVCRLLLE